MFRASSTAAFLLLALCSCRERSRETRAAEVAAGANHACARLVDGAVRCWGEDRLGQLGQGARWSGGSPDGELFLRRDDEARAVQVVGIDKVEELAAGGAHTCARRSDGTVWCWGDNSACQLGLPAGQPFAADAVVRHPVRTPGLSEAVQLTAGQAHGCARRSDASVWCWGGGEQGKRGQQGCAAAQVPLPGGALEVRAAANRTCALLADATVHCWTAGPGESSVPRPVPAARDVVQLAVAPGHACGLTRAGTVLCWGSAAGGAMGDGVPAGTETQAAVAVPALARSTRVAAGLHTTCGRAADARHLCVGAGQPGVWELPVLQASSQVAFANTGLAAGAARPAGCAVMTNGACMCWGRVAPGASEAPVQVSW
jgi:hypothetical protein